MHDGKPTQSVHVHDGEPTQSVHVHDGDQLRVFMCTMVTNSECSCA